MPSWDIVLLAFAVVAIVLGGEWLIVASLRKLGRFLLGRITTEFDKANKRQK